MKKYDKLTFVDHSDTCRAPMAETLLQTKLLLEDILVDTRGMVVLFPEPVNPKVRDILEQNGLPAQEHEARALTRDDFDDRTLLLTMEQAQKEKILEQYGADAKNVYTFAEYCGQEGDVESPLGKDMPAYRACFRQIRDWVELLGTVIKEEDAR